MVNPKLDVYSFINLFGILIGLFFASIILRLQRGNRRTNRLAALLVLNMAIIATGSFCSYSGYLEILPKLQKIFSPFLFLMGPLLLWYVRSLLKGVAPTCFKPIHFGPAVLNILYNIPFYLMSDAEKVALLPLGITPAVRIIRILTLIHFLGYLLITLREIRCFREKAKDNFSSLSRIKLKWIATLGFSLGTILLINIVPELSLPFFLDLTKIWEALLIIMLVYKAFSQPELFIGAIPPAQSKNENKSRIDAAELQVQLERLDDFMKREKPFLNPDLTLGILAEQLDMTAALCSRVINQQLGMNFFHYINHHRVEEFKALANLPHQKKNILELALAVGFNSKSTFNAIFKQFEGQTPSQHFKKKAP